MQQDAFATLQTPEQLDAMTAALKAANRRLFHNCFLSEAALRDHIRRGRLRCDYRPGRWLNLLCPEQDFLRLYLFLADPDGYALPPAGGRVVCDLFVQKENDRTLAVRRALEQDGFAPYAVFHKWQRRYAPVAAPLPAGVRLVEGAVPGFYPLLCRCFDPLTDYLPAEADAPAFLGERLCCSAVSEPDGALLGGIVITPQGRTQTEEFVFVDPARRGRGIAGALHAHWYAAQPEGTLSVAWVRDGNAPSEALHTAFGYQRQNGHKTTMIKET